MEAVEIDIVMGGDFATQMKEVRAGVAGLGTETDTFMAKLRASLAEEQQALKQVEADVKNIEKSFNKAAPGNSKIELGQEFAAAKKALEEQKVIVDDLKGKIKEAAAANVTLRTEQMRVTDEMRKMRLAGQENTAMYDTLRKKAGELADAQKQVTQEIKQSSQAGNGVFAGMVDAATGISGAMQTAMGAVALFGGENENLEKIQTRLVALMSITNGLQEVSNTLHTASAFRIGVVTAAKRAWATATTFLNTQLGISVGLSKALMASGVGLLLAGIGLLVSKIIEWRQGQEGVNKQQEEAKKKAEALAAVQSKLAGDYGKQQAEIESLRAALHSETLAYDKKEEIIKKLQKIIPEYTASLSKEGKVIRENTAALDAYMAILERSLKLKAAQEELEGLYKNLYEIEKKTSELQSSNDKVRKVNTGQNFSARVESYATEIDIKIKEGNETKETIKKEIDKVKKYIGDNNLIALPEVKIVKPQKTEKTKKELYDAAADVQALLKDINGKTQALQLSLMEDNLQKRLAVLNSEEQQELAKISEREAKILAEYNKSHGTKHTNIAGFDAAGAKQIEQQRLNLTAEYTQKRTAIETDGEAQITAARQEALDTYKSELDRQIDAISKKYAELRKKAEQNSKDGTMTAADKAILNNAENFEKSLLIVQTTTDNIKKRQEEMMKNWGDMAKGGIAALRSIGDALADLDSELSKAISHVANLAESFVDIMKGAASSNIMGVVGGIAGVVSEIIKIKSDSKKADADEKARAAQWQTQQDTAESKLLRASLDRRKIEDAINKSRLQVIDEEKSLLRAKNAELVQSSQKLVDIIKEQTYSDTETRGSSGRDNSIRVTVPVKRKISDYLYGTHSNITGGRTQVAKELSLDETIVKLQELEARGKLDANAIAILHELEANQQVYNAALEDTIKLEERRKEALTGTTTDALLDGLKAGLKEGKKSFQDFSEDAEDMLRESLMSALTASFQRDKLNALYEQLYADLQSDSALTAEEAERFKQGYANIGQEFQNAMDNLNAAGIDLTGSGSDSALSGAIKGITENTASLLAGQMNAIRVNVVAQLSQMDGILAAVQRISIDTGNYLPYLQKIDTGITDLRVNGIFERRTA
jgi:hypothetical protein